VPISGKPEIGVNIAPLAFGTEDGEAGVVDLG